MKSSHKRDISVMSEWHSVALIHGMNPAGTIMNALRFSLILSVICAKEGHALDVLMLQERTFSALCKNMRECLGHMTVDELAADIMEVDMEPPTTESSAGPWGKELK